MDGITYEREAIEQHLALLDAAGKPPCNPQTGEVLPGAILIPNGATLGQLRELGYTPQPRTTAPAHPAGVALAINAWYLGLAAAGALAARALSAASCRFRKRTQR